MSVDLVVVVVVVVPNLDPRGLACRAAAHSSTNNFLKSAPANLVSHVLAGNVDAKTCFQKTAYE